MDDGGGSDRARGQDFGDGEPRWATRRARPVGKRERRFRTAREVVGPADSAGSIGSIDLAAEIPRLRTRALRMLALAASFVVLFVAAIVALGVLRQRSEDLLKTGRQANGVVVTFAHADRGNSSMSVDYRAGSESRRARVVVDSGRHYLPGQAVTVFYDPADPARVRTTEERNNDDSWVLVMPLPLLLGGVVGSAGTALGWWRRYRGVCRTGWQPVTATVVGLTRYTLYLEVRHRGGCTPLAADSNHLRFLGGGDRPVWLGGKGRYPVLLVPEGKRGAPSAIRLRVRP